jgi:peptidyl-tRNA hydrolase
LARAWAGGTFTKIILAVEDESALNSQLASAGIVHALLEESRLQGRATAISVAPRPKSAVAPVLGRLPLLK